MSLVLYLLSAVLAVAPAPAMSSPADSPDISLDRTPSPDAIRADTSCSAIAPGLHRRAPDTLAAASNLRTAAPAPTGAGPVHAVVEIPAGTADKWEVAEDGRALAIERQDGQRRRIDYLPYPANYGFIPRTRSTTEAGGDGDPLDIVLLGPATPCGAVVQARLIGALHLVDDGEQDDKMLAVRPGTPLGDVHGLDELRDRYPGVLDILETWFVHYEGPGNRSRGFVDAAAARAIVTEAARNVPASPGR
jgi:inorganic pyrophosphatase